MEKDIQLYKKTSGNSWEFAPLLVQGIPNIEVDLYFDKDIISYYPELTYILRKDNEILLSGKVKEKIQGIKIDSSYLGQELTVKYNISPVVAKSQNFYLDNYGITEVYIKISGKKFSQTSWDEISYYSKNGMAASLWNVGDSKELPVLKDGSKKNVYIIGFNHNYISEGYNLIHLCVGASNIGEGLQSGPYLLSLNNSYSYNFEDGEKYIYNLIDNFYNLLPDNFKKHIRTVYKTINGINKYKLKIFLLSEKEVFGRKSNQEEEYYSDWKEALGEKQYDFFSSLQGSNIRYQQNNQQQAIDWWLRSPKKDSGVYYCVCSARGQMSYKYQESSLYVCLCFCI